MTSDEAYAELIKRSRDTTILASCYQLLSWDEGRFHFTQGNLSSAVDEINAPTTLLLVEAARRADEAAAST